MSVAEALRAPQKPIPMAAIARDGMQRPVDVAPFQPEFREVRRLVSRFEPITLAEMDQVALMDRTDTKYILSSHQLFAGLAALCQDYRILEVEGVRLNRYRTLYFDTREFDLYMQHHDGKRVRYKVRSREYEDTGIDFIEVKAKGKRGRTVKSRIRTQGFVTSWAPSAEQLARLGLEDDAPRLEPKVENRFYRITLAGIYTRERVTMDLGLEYSGNGRRIGLPGVVVAEVKQSGMDRDSAFIQCMRRAGLRPGSFSKYCVGVSLLFGVVKHNRFNGELRLINRLMEVNTNA